MLVPFLLVFFLILKLTSFFDRHPSNANVDESSNIAQKRSLSLCAEVFVVSYYG